MKTNWVWQWKNALDPKRYYSGILDGSTCASDLSGANLYPTKDDAISRTYKLDERGYDLIGLTDKELFILRLKG